MIGAFHLPNRMYYSFLVNTTQKQLDHTMENVMIYAALELLSFIGLSIVLQRKLRLATVYQLAFVLEKNHVGVQSRLVFWVVYMIQNALVHYGMSPVGCCILAAELLSSDVSRVLQAQTTRSSLPGCMRRTHLQICNQIFEADFPYLVYASFSYGNFSLRQKALILAFVTLHSIHLH